MTEEIIGQCSECGADCTDRDLVGNQTELGFPILWCSACVDKSYAAYEEELSQDQTVRYACGGAAIIGILLALTGLKIEGFIAASLAATVYVIHAHKHAN